LDGELGQLEPAVACDHDDAVVITLDRPRWVFAARAWFHDGVPRRLGVDVEEPSGSWRTVFETLGNEQWTSAALSFPGRGEKESLPVTTDFSAALARRIRYRVRCDAKRPYDATIQGQSVWLYEIEVFSRLARWEAWWR
jgi:hypothetical protein